MIFRGSQVEATKLKEIYNCAKQNDLGDGDEIPVVDVYLNK